MTRIHNEILIQAPIEKVWGILSDLEQVQYYNPLVTHTVYTSESKQGVGASRHCDFKPKGFSNERVCEFRPEEKVIGFEIVESSFPMVYSNWRTALHQQGNATLVTQDMNYKLKYGPIGALMDVLFVRRQYGKILQNIFEGLKKYAETGERQKK